MIRAIAPILLIVLPLCAQADVYKCQQGGKLVFSDVPCADGKAIDVRPAAGGQVHRSAEYWEGRRQEEERKRREWEAQVAREAEQEAARQAKFASTPRSGADDAKLMERAKAEVIKVMIDPESSRFRNLYVTSKGVCGEVNSKNRMGGYTGFTGFLVEFEPKPKVWTGNDKIVTMLVEGFCGR